MLLKHTPLYISLAFFLSATFTQSVMANDGGDYGKETALTLAESYAGRYTGTPQEIAASHYIQQRMRIASSEYQPTRQDFSFVAKRGALAGQTLHSSNIVVKQAGVGETGKTLFIGAHYDSAPSTRIFDRSTLQGLDDNASGIGVMTELVRNLSQIQTEHSATFIGFGSEEYGLEGSRNYVSSLSATEKQNAIGMINLDSLITGDHMYANAGDNAYDLTNQKVVPKYASLREHAEAIAKSLGIDLQKNEGNLLAEGASEPYKPYGVGCCSDQESFAAAGMPVVAFEATNWRLGPEYDGYTQTDNPKIADGSTWHDPKKDNKTVLTDAFGKERINQRMRDFSRIITRLIVEETNADILASMQSALRQQSVLGNYLQNTTTSSKNSVFERANYLTNHTLADNRVPKTTRLWFDAHQGYQSQANPANNDADKSNYTQLGIYAGHTVAPDWEIGVGLEGKYAMDNDQTNLRKDKSYGGQLYSIYTSPTHPWWNTATLGYTKHNLDTTRQVTLGGSNGVPVIIDNTERGNVDANVRHANTELGYNFINQPTQKHGIYMSTNYSDIDFDAYRSGTSHSRTGLSIQDTTSHAWDAEVGYQLQHNITIASTPINLKAKLGYVNVIDAPITDKLSATSFADGKVRHVAFNQEKDDHYGRLELGVSSNLATGTWAYINGETDFAHSQDRDDNYAIQLGIQHQF